jgi:CBS-domain-containing membrane protein
MTRSAIGATEETDVDEVRHLLVQRHIHRMLVGIVSRSDVAALLATESVCQLRSEPVRGQRPPLDGPKCQAGPGSFVCGPIPGS